MKPPKFCHPVIPLPFDMMGDGLGGGSYNPAPRNRYLIKGAVCKLREAVHQGKPPEIIRGWMETVASRYYWRFGREAGDGKIKPGTPCES